MGREIRRVPPPEMWTHPKKQDGHYQPMFAGNYTEALEEWWVNHKNWPEVRDSKVKSLDLDPKDYKFFAQWDGDPPSVEYYMPDIPTEKRTWFAVYETVTEGTPVTPPFESKEELCRYLSTRGTFWDDTPWTEENARAFCEDGWAPSGMVRNGRYYTSKEIPSLLKEEDQ